MQGTFISFNTAGITFEERFLALLLKVKQKNGQCQTYYLQAPVLADLLTILQYRLLRTFQRLQEQGDSYKEELIACNESLMASIPEVDMAEIQQPDPEKRIMSIVPKFGESDTTLILALQNEHICTLCIEDKQVEAMTLAINQSLKVADDQTVIQYISSSMDFLMCYAVDLTTQPNIDYQQYSHEDWKQNLFFHYLGVLYWKTTSRCGLLRKAPSSRRCTRSWRHARSSVPLSLPSREECSVWKSACVLCTPSIWRGKQSLASDPHLTTTPLSALAERGVTHQFGHL